MKLSEMIYLILIICVICVFEGFMWWFIGNIAQLSSFKINLCTGLSCGLSGYFIMKASDHNFK